VSATQHGLALRAPWYVCERGHFDRFDSRARAPEIQKYDTPELVGLLLQDPRQSLLLQADDGDVWMFAVPREKEPEPSTLRGRLSPFVPVRSNVCKLYQPNHERFYALTIELFCDAPGLPRPPLGLEVEVGFVIRRLRISFNQYETLDDDLKQLARSAAEELFGRGFPNQPMPKPVADTAADPTALFRPHLLADAELAAFEASHAQLIERVGMTQELQGWYLEADGRGQWVRVPQRSDEPVPPGTELELPMWRLPPLATSCERARTRSLWFGLLPTYSRDHDPAGNPKFDEHNTYVAECLARRQRPPPRQACPPFVTWSAGTVPYRLAAFPDAPGNETPASLPEDPLCAQ
jgi:hypothetical protein